MIYAENIEKDKLRCFMDRLIEIRDNCKSIYDKTPVTDPSFDSRLISVADIEYVIQEFDEFFPEYHEILPE